jgi:hypothetical protein
MDAVQLQQFDGNYTENLMNEWGSFFIPFGWTNFVGTGSAVVNGERSFKGSNSLKITNSLPSNLINVWSGNTQDIINLTAGTYFLSFAVYNPNAANIQGRLIAQDAFSTIETFEFNLNDVKDQWVTFGQVFTIAGNTQLRFNYEIEGNGASSITYIDAIKVERNDRGNALPARYVLPKLVLPIVISFTETINFPSILAGEFADISLEAIGAVLSDVVVIGTPILTSDYLFIAFVSGVDDVTIRCINRSAVTLDLPAGVFKIKIIK